MVTVAIALGGNQGDVIQAFSNALSELDRHPLVQLFSRSRNFQTQPMGAQSGSKFVNAVAVLRTDLPPDSLLQELQRIELLLGRVREVRWGPRVLDLDILSYGDAVFDLDLSALVETQRDLSRECLLGHSPAKDLTGRLVVPHPGSWYRRFVLEPWCDVAPSWRHPLAGESICQLLERLKKEKLLLTVDCLNGSDARNEFVTQLGRHSLNGRFEICESSSAPSDFHFQFGDDLEKTASTSSRVISLPATSTGVALALTVLECATDEPTVIKEL